MVGNIHGRKYSWSEMALILIMMVLSLLLHFPRPAFAAPLSIGQARQMSDGIEVTVTGRVTVTSGQFESASFDRGFALQDPTGGIYVSTNQVTELQRGETFTVTGTLQDDGHGQRIIQMQAGERQDRGAQAVTPKAVSIHEAKTLDGTLVTVDGTITRAWVSDSPYGDRLWITDDTGIVQIYMPCSTEIAPATLSFLKPGQPIQVTGLSSAYNGRDEVIPRDRQDLVPNAAAPDNTDQYRA